MTDMNSPSHPSLRVEIDPFGGGYPAIDEPIFIGCTTGAPADPSKGNIIVTVTGEGVGSAPGVVSISTTSGIERGSERSKGIINVSSVTNLGNQFDDGIAAAVRERYRGADDNRPTYPDGGPIGAEPVVRVGTEVAVHDRADRGKVTRVYQPDHLVPGTLLYDVEFSDCRAGPYHLSDLRVVQDEPADDIRDDYFDEPAKIDGRIAIYIFGPQGSGKARLIEAIAPLIPRDMGGRLTVIEMTTERPRADANWHYDYLRHEITQRGGVIDPEDGSVDWPEVTAYDFVTERDIWLADRGEKALSALPFAKSFHGAAYDFDRIGALRLREIVRRFTDIVRDNTPA